MIGNARLQVLPVWELSFENMAPGAAPIATAKVKHDPEYQANLRRRILAGEAAHMESLPWFYCVGKPRDTVRLEYHG